MAFKKPTLEAGDVINLTLTNKRMDEEIITLNGLVINNIRYNDNYGYKMTFYNKYNNSPIVINLETYSFLIQKVPEYQTLAEYYNPIFTKSIEEVFLHYNFFDIRISNVIPALSPGIKKDLVNKQDKANQELYKEFFEQLKIYDTQPEESTIITY
jgi:hypothetical protein